MPGSLLTTIIWYEGDESLHVPRAHGNSMENNSQFIPFKPSDRIQLKKILSQIKSKTSYNLLKESKFVQKVLN